MKAWFLSLSQRERVIVSVGGGLAVVFMLYWGVAKPFADGLESKRSSVVAKQKELQWMQASAQEVRSLKSSNRGPASSNKAPYLLLDDAIRRAGMPAPSRLEPQGKDGTIAQFEAVAFDGLLKMLAGLKSRSGLEISDLSVSRREGDLVSATVTLKRAGS